MEKIQNIPKELLTATLHLDYKTPMSTVITHLKKYPAVVLYKDKDYYGIVDSRSIYRASKGLKFQDREKIDNFVVRVPTDHEQHLDIRACEFVLQIRGEGAPVFQRQQDNRRA